MRIKGGKEQIYRSIEKEREKHTEGGEVDRYRESGMSA